MGKQVLHTKGDYNLSHRNHKKFLSLIFDRAHKAIHITSIVMDTPLVGVLTIGPDQTLHCYYHQHLLTANLPPERCIITCATWPKVLRAIFQLEKVMMTKKNVSLTHLQRYNVTMPSQKKNCLHKL